MATVLVILQLLVGTSLLVRKVAQPTNYRILVNRVQAYHYIPLVIIKYMVILF